MGLTGHHPRRRGGVGNNSIQTQILDESKEMTFLRIEVNTAE